jgi:hypothetical protein
MLKMVDGTGIIGVDMICPLGVSTPQPPNYDRVELEGTGILVLPNSLDAPLERLELGGKTEQVQTSGKNLFDTSFAKNKENYKEVTNAGSVIYAIELSLKPNTKYAFQCVIKSVPTTMNVGNSTIRYVVSDGQKRVITTNEDGKLYIGFSGNPDGEIHKIGASIVDIQVEESTTVTPYEPYTGGKPSPSPEYPQEIKNVGKWNEEAQKYEVDVKITNAEQNWSKEQTLTLTSDRPITKWDRLVEQGGEIGWLYAGVVIDRFDGQSNKISIANKNGDVQNFSIQFDNVPNGNGNTDIFIDKYRAVQLSYTKAEYGICCNWNDGVKYFSAPNKNVATVDEFKAWLVENPLKIAYETTNPEFVPLPQSEQNAIRALKTYYPTTVITADGGELDPDIKVTYRKEI